MKYLDYTTPQQKVIALLAYECLNFHNTPVVLPLNREKYSHRADTAAHACALLGVSDDTICAIRRGEIKGVQNIARFTSNVEYTQNYSFDPYCQH